jgi:hypothetical protein
MHCALPPSEPPNGVHPCCLRLAAVGGARPRGGWRSSVTARLQGFSSGSPAAVPHRRSPRMMIVGLVVGEASRAAASAPPSASRMFIILAVAEGEPSRGSTSRMGRQAASSFSIQGRGRSPALRRGRTLTTLDRSAASVVSCSVPGLLAQLALARPPTPPPAAWSGRCCPSTARAAIAPCAPGDHTRCRTPHGRRSCSWIVLSSLRHDASTRRSMPACLGGREWGSAGVG